MMRSFAGMIMILLLFQGVVSGQKAKPRATPKNIIVMIGDGMGYNHIQAANYYLGMKQQVFEQFPVRLAMAHYPAMAGDYAPGKPAGLRYATGYNPAIAWQDTAYLKSNFTESAAAATALATGVKTYNGSIGLSVRHDTLENLVRRAKSLGKSAGVVTTVEFCHATPAGFVAHNIARSNYPELAAEMLLKSRCDVIMGCGDPSFDNNGKALTGNWNDGKYVVDSAFWQQFISGSGQQTEFLVKGKPFQVADIDGDRKPDAWTLVRTKAGFEALQTGKTPRRVMGCPNVYETLQEARTAKSGEEKNSVPWFTPLNPDLPTLAMMVKGALNVLDNNRRGFFLMVEGGAIDWAAHSNHKGRLIEEMTGFFDAVDAVIAWVEQNSNWNETLVIVTADHETGLLWGDKPFAPVIDHGKGNLPGMTFYSGNHTNSLLPFFAKGPGSDIYNLFADEQDSVCGAFIQNSEVAQGVKVMWPSASGYSMSGTNR